MATPDPFGVDLLSEALVARARHLLLWRQRLARRGLSPWGSPSTSLPPDPAPLADRLAFALLLEQGGAGLDAAAPISKLGGWPNALPGGGWPMVGAKPGWEHALPAPMSFVAQIDVAMVADLHPDAAALPRAGWLLFFLDEFFSAEGGCGDPHLRPCRVVHAPSLADGAVRPPPLANPAAWSLHEIAGGGSDHYAAFALTGVQPGLTLGPFSYEEWHGPFSDAVEAVQQLIAQARPDDRRHQMFGWPGQQSDLSGAAWERLGCGDWQDLPRGDDPWVTLLQVDSIGARSREGPPRMLWHDGGMLLFLIRRSHLRAGRWDQVVALVDG